MNRLTKLSQTAQFIWSHPLNQGQRSAALRKFIWWQIRSRLSRQPAIIGWVDDARFIVRRGETGLTGNLYAGFMEWKDMLFLLHYLRPQVTFVDVGANIGAYTILASKVVGCNSLAFEPIFSTVEKLRKQVAVNSIENLVRVINCGVGSKNEKLCFTNNHDTRNKVSLSKDVFVTEVPVISLDSQEYPTQSLFLKIDVEGYEYEVLKGAAKLLSSGRVIAILVELNGGGGDYGRSNEEIHDYITSHHFIPISYDPLRRVIQTLSSFNPNNENTIYVRDVESAGILCKEAPSRVVHTAYGRLI
ncbi:FkbM family methyltransferase [Polynucleobacter sp. AP-Kaivos-20-H2]|uniref:FkbM family methyltransferase n=1 Tax=Polynucleobacter sp. AP-Kaivos-20-H2 TaxID=2689104 RepID=UPI001C0C1245|nr:FkbM family methyltransferase [Polynucleobacter sp. AP-Kaivos-20-H2]MBU3604149.1 FkbM family methyltransferase [Polynucleobacter sp. AP-Kaivos-20-H2]